MNFLLYWVDLEMFRVSVSWLVLVLGVNGVRVIWLLVGEVSVLVLLKVSVVGVFCVWLFI